MTAFLAPEFAFSWHTIFLSFPWPGVDIVNHRTTRTLPCMLTMLFLDQPWNIKENGAGLSEGWGEIKIIYQVAFMKIS